MRQAFDTEFSFDDNGELFVVCAAVTSEDGTQHTWWYDQLDDLKQFILDHKKDIWVAHNVETAEAYVFLSLGLRPTQFKWHDTMLMNRVAYNVCSTDSVKLDNLAACLEREGIAHRDHDEKKEDQMICVYCPESTTWDLHLRKLNLRKKHLLEYCLKDTEHLLELDSVLNAKISEPFDPDLILDHAKPLEPERRATWFGFLAAYMGECGWRGIPMSPERVGKLICNAPKAIAYLQKGFEKKYPGSFRIGKKKITTDVKKCREYAAAQYGPEPPLTAKGEVSLASEFTKKFENVPGFLWDYHEMTKHCRALLSFCRKERDRNWLGHFVRNKNIVRPRINLLSAITGRCGSKPKSGFVYVMGKPFRGLVDPPPGRVLVELDYHSEEIACQAYLSNDDTMADMYDNPRVEGDYYKTLAVEVFGADVSERDTYKRIALMSNYGCGVSKLATVSNKPEEFCEEALDKLKEAFHTYWDYDSDCIRNCQRYGYIAFSDGWRIQHDRKHPGKPTTLVNWPFQGVGALILRKMLFNLWKNNIELVAPVHDAVIFLADEDTWQQTAAVVTKCMEDASEECLGRKIGVGEPEVTFHGLVNCHSEFSTREQYLEKKYSKKTAKYFKLFEKYTTVSEDEIPDTQNMYVDEPINT